MSDVALKQERRAVRNFLLLAPDTRAQVMRDEFGWEDAIDWDAGGWSREIKSMMTHVRDTQQRSKFIERFVEGQKSAVDCQGSHGAHTPIVGERLHGRCPSCGRLLRLVGGEVNAGWGRTRLPRHHAQPRDRAASIARLREIATIIKASEEVLAEMRVDRDTLMRELCAAGFTQREIARVTGKSRVRVHQIKNEEPEGES